MRGIIFTLLLLMPSIVCAGDAARPPEVLVSQSIRWIKAPAAYRRSLQWGNATILYFGADGKFGMADGVLNREGRTLSVSHGDGLNIYAGEWSEESGVLKVSYCLVGRTTPQVGEILPGPIQTQSGQFRRSATPAEFTFLGRSFVPREGLAVDEVRHLFAEYWAR